MEPFEGTGLWFLPHATDSRVPGILRISKRGEIRLSLIGSLRPGGPKSGDTRFPIILGFVHGPLGDTVTLVNCFRTRASLGPVENVREEYLARRGLFGACFTEESDLKFRRLQLRVGGLRAWANPLSGLRRGNFEFDSREAVPLLSYVMPSSVVAAIPGGEVFLEFMLSASNDLRSSTFAEEPAFSITSETPLAEGELTERFLGPLQNLLTFVCDAPQAVEGDSLWREDVLAPFEEANPEIKVFGARLFPDTEERDAEESRPRHQLLFSVADVEQDFGSFINGWLRLADTYADACNVYFGLQYAPPAFLDLTFAGVVQSLFLYYNRRVDGIERRGQEETRLGEILSRLDGEDADWVRNRLGARPYPPLQDALTVLLAEHAEMMGPLLRRDAGGFVAEVMNTLRYVLSRDPETNIVAHRGADLHWMTAKLRILMKLCFLKELGFSTEKVTAMLRSNDLYVHISQLTTIQRSRTD